MAWNWLLRTRLWFDLRPRRPTRKGASIALMTYQSLFEPAVEHVIEYQRTGDLIIRTSDEPDRRPREPDSDSGLPVSGATP